MRQKGISLIKVIVIVAVILFLSGFILYVSINSHVVSSINALFTKPSTENLYKLNEQELIHVVKPAVVRIIHRVKGSLSITPDFKIDMNTLTIVDLKPGKPITVPVPDQYFAGSGFIVSPDGYIMTNAHVVSDQEVVDIFVATLSKEVWIKTIASMPASLKKKVTAFINTKEGAEKIKKLYTDISDRLQKNTIADLESSITVLDPSSKETNVASLIESGFPADIKVIHNEYYKDQKDIAILKIEQNNLPAIPIVSATSSLRAEGQKMYVLGFPGGADIGGDSAQSGYLQATFSPGVVTALKDSIKGDFKVIQSDTKISGGSSGSPAFDELGRVFGIVTYESAAAEGDNFSFAIPAQTALSIINTKDIHLEPGLLYNHFLKGIELSKKNHCLEAIKEFEDSEKINSKFRYDDNFLASYIDSCKSIQSQGLSIDNEWDQLILNLKSIKTTLIYVAIGLCIIFLFIFVIVVLVRRMKKDEIQLEQFTRRESVKVDQQENILSHQLKQITEVSDPETTIVTQNSVPVSAPVSEHKIQDIVDLIHRQKQAGIQGGPLVLYLRKAGYADSEIQEAFNQINKIY